MESSLPADLLHRILSLLPLRTLFRFRCVCRAWRSLPFSLLFVDFSGSSPLLHPPDAALHHWLFAFRLLARKVNESRVMTYKSSRYIYSIAYDREMLGSSGHSLEAQKCSEFLGAAEGRYAILNTGSPLLAHFNTGVLDMVDSANGLLLLMLRLEVSCDRARLFVYNPISKDLRGLPTTQWASQKLAMVAVQEDGGRNSAYKIYSLGRHYMPGTTNLLYSFEVYDSAQAANGWQTSVDVKANLSASDLRPASERALMCNMNPKASCNHELGFFYWMTSLGYKAETGRHTELEACDMNSGFFYRLPGLTFRTSFASMWPHASGLQLACGVAVEGDLSSTSAVEIWELHQGKETPQSDENVYGARRWPEGTEWQRIDKMPQVLWDQLTGSANHRRIACAISMPLVFVIAEDEEEKMVAYNVSHKSWQLVSCWTILQQLFNDKHASYYQVFPWIFSLRPNPCSVA